MNHTLPKNQGEYPMFYQEKGVYGNSVMHFHTPSTAALEYLFYCNYCGLFYCNRLYRICRTQHEFYEPYLFVFVKKGCLHLDYKELHYHAHSGECLLFDCRLAHCYYADDNTVFQYIHFGGNISDYYFNRLSDKDRHHFCPSNADAISGALSRLLINMEDPMPNEHVISSDIHHLLSLLLTGSQQHSSLNAQRINAAIRFMDAHLSENITLDDISAEAGLNASYFSRLFRQYADTSPYDYLASLRISHAKRLLVATSDSVAAIAEACGFHDPVHFSKTFKKRCGHTPLQFRKAYTVF